MTKFLYFEKQNTRILSQVLALKVYNQRDISKYILHYISLQPIEKL